MDNMLFTYVVTLQYLSQNLKDKMIPEKRREGINDSL